MIEHSPEKRFEERLDGRIALITGASRGIGHAAARSLAAAGAHVIVLARTVGGLESLDDEIRTLDPRENSRGDAACATLVPLDLGDACGIDRLAHSVLERFGRLDILVANAGRLGVLAPLHHIPAEDWTRTIEINLNANWRLIRAFDPLLRRSDAGRAIFVTSGSAEKCKSYWGVYSVSKAALDAMVRTWVEETRGLPLRVNSISPGPVRTAMRARAMPGEDPMLLPSPEDIAPLFLRLAASSCKLHGEMLHGPGLIQPDDGA